MAFFLISDRISTVVKSLILLTLKERLRSGCPGVRQMSDKKRRKVFVSLEDPKALEELKEILKGEVRVLKHAQPAGSQEDAEEGKILHLENAGAAELEVTEEQYKRIIEHVQDRHSGISGIEDDFRIKPHTETEAPAVIPTELDWSAWDQVGPWVYPPWNSPGYFKEYDNHAAWAVTVTGARWSQSSGKGIRVGVIDTGCDVLHPDLEGKIVAARNLITDMDPENVEDDWPHGTQCASIIGARRESQVWRGRRYSIAPECELVIAKVLDRRSDRQASILTAIDFCMAEKCSVISISLGGGCYSFGEHPGGHTNISSPYDSPRWFQQGVFIAASAGNESDRQAGMIGGICSPARGRSVCAVAAVDRHLDVANFSSRAHIQNPIDLAAPGTHVWAARPMNGPSVSPWGYGGFTGTSAACPIVAGLAALWAESDGARGAFLWQRLAQHARKLENVAEWDVGAGLVQAPWR